MSDMTTLFGIKNCDSVKRARDWLVAQGIEHVFHDFRADGLSKNQLQAWIDKVGPDRLINKRSTTWKQLPPADQTLALNGSISAVVLANPTLIKRPVLQTGDVLLIGFDPAEYEQQFLS